MFINTIRLVTVWCCVVLAVPAWAEQYADMSLHHVHITQLNHGLHMAVEGQNLLLIGEMSMAQTLDPVTKGHGKAMLKAGKELIVNAVEGPAMKDAMANQPITTAMTFTHQLAKAMLAVVAAMESAHAVADSAGHMTVDHMNMTLNHAVGMAATGCNLIMIGHMGMAKPVDVASIEHGKAMIADAQKLIDDVMSSAVMKQLMESEATAPEMIKTHEVAAAAGKLIKLMQSMPGVSH